MIDHDGHIKLTDFGFAKKIEDKTFTLCGTPVYLAPEVILGQGHDQSVDWWALGIFMFEVMAGYPPFYDVNPQDMYKRISIGYFEFPGSIQQPSRDLISSLL